MMAGGPMTRSTVLRRLLPWLLLPTIPLAAAQYAFDTSRDGHAETGTRYFGSARDDQGTRLPDVIFLLDSPQVTFSFVTDGSGRFAGVAPVELRAGTASARCVKAGFQQVRLSQRPGPRNGRRTLQIDCVLRRTASS